MIEKYLKPAVVAIVAVIAFNALCSFFAPLKSAVNSLPGNSGTWG